MSDVSSIKNSVNIVAEPWIGSTYYDDAEQWTFLWWDDNRPFKPMFDRLDKTSVLELACGHGRHSERVAPVAGRLILMDVLPENIAFCRNRIKGGNVEYILNNGFDFRPVEDASLTSIFCYDAMVHFSKDIVASYLRDAHRVLRPGGMALLHHSNYSGPSRDHYGQHPGARNLMQRLEFQALSNSAGFAVLQSTTFTWAETPDLDCLSLLQKI